MKRLILMIVLLAGACDGTRNMKIQTFELSRLSVDEATTLLTPYVRQGGMISGENRLITVREKPDRLTLIEDLLRKYDGVGRAQDIALTLQIIEANGYAERDTAIADIEPTLREMFRFRGYRLAGQTSVRAREQSNFEQILPGYRIAGSVHRLSEESGDRRLPITIELTADKRRLSSTVTATLGKPIVLGQSGGGGAIILVIRPALAGT